METDAISRNVDDRSWQRDRQLYRKRQREEGGSSKFAAAADQDELEVVRVENSRLGKFKFDDATTADVLLTFTCSRPTAGGNPLESHKEETVGKVHLHSRVLGQSRYFKTLLSKRWQDSKPKASKEESNEGSVEQQLMQIKLSLPANRELPSYLTTLSLLYSGNFSSVIVEVQTALAILIVATELLFDGCIAACIAFLEAVPWTKDEEKAIVLVVTDLQLEASNLLARLSRVWRTMRLKTC